MLLSNKHLQRSLDMLKSRFVSTSMYKATGGSGVVGVGPRYGVYSLMAMDMPMFVYDSKELSVKFNTAFTDGSNIFFNADFLNALIQEDSSADKTNGVNNTHSFIPVLMHELTHIIMLHTTRQSLFGKNDVTEHYYRLACEHAVNCIVMNTMDELGIKPGNLFKAGVGVADEKCKTFKGLNEHIIAKMLMKDDIQQLMSNIADELLQTNEKTLSEKVEKIANDLVKNTDKFKDTILSNIDSTKPHNKIASDVSSAIEKEAIKRIQDSFAPIQPDYLTPKELDELLRSIGEGELADKLKLTEMGNKSPDELKDEIMNRVLSANERMEQIVRSSQDPSSVPGAHLTDFIKRKVAAESESKLNWRTEIISRVIGDGTQYNYTEDIICPEFFIDPVDLGTNISPFSGLSVSSTINPNEIVAVIGDTSSSVTDKMLSEFSSVIGSLARDIGDSIKIGVFSSDTTLRGEPVFLNSFDVADIRNTLEFEFAGGGGTSILNGIKDTINYCNSSDLKVRHIVFMSDMEDLPIKRSDLPENMPKITFVCPAGHDKAAKKLIKEITDIASYVSVDMETMISII